MASPLGAIAAFFKQGCCDEGGEGASDHCPKPNPAGFGLGHAMFGRFGPGWRNITVGGRENGSQSYRNFNVYAGT